ncbi:MAG: hypothetical protein LUF04_03310 [Bacteroides sp.]|nr:hypothetical protein [Bacteroides sp.]
MKPFHYTKLSELSGTRIENYLDQYIVPHVFYTSLPGPDIEKLNEFVGKGGLNERHLHLNAATEMDTVWQDCLDDTQKFYNYFLAASGNAFVKEQIEYEDAYKDAKELRRLLITARALRWHIITEYLFLDLSEIPSEWYYNRIDKMNAQVLSGCHPLKEKLKDRITPDKYTSLSWECLMHIMILSRLSNRGSKYKDPLSTLYHHYLLIMGVVNKFVVQQLHQKGFQQFQKVADNKFREISKEKYSNCFLQLNGNENSRKLIHHMEGRITPDKDSESLVKKIGAIYEELKKYIEIVGLPPGTENEIFSLTVHFLKSWETQPKTAPCKNLRHRTLRKQLRQQAQAIIDYNSIPKKNATFSIPITGIDAASSEFSTPPEVFGPVYRLLRTAGIAHFTFHAGEDFSHILSGLRAIFEALEFLELQANDRISHCTALGICPTKWIERLGKHIYLPQGEWLDNLVFIYHLVYNGKETDLTHRIMEEIETVCKEVYDGSVYSFKELKEAWLLRKYCPILFFCDDISEAGSLPVFDRKEWDAIEEIKHGTSNRVLSLLKHYHFNRIGYNRVVYQEKELVTAEEIREFQELVIQQLLDKGIIIETLPTSNTRISIYETSREHHLQRWLSEDRKGNYPKIVVGTDDPGVFSTNIYNEYAHVYTLLESSGNPNTDKIMEELYTNSFTYGFPAKKMDPLS